MIFRIPGDPTPFVVIRYWETRIGKSLIRAVKGIDPSGRREVYFDVRDVEFALA